MQFNPQQTCLIVLTLEPYKYIIYLKAKLNQNCPKQYLNIIYKLKQTNKKKKLQCLPRWSTSTIVWQQLKSLNIIQNKTTWGFWKLNTNRWVVSWSKHMNKFPLQGYLQGFLFSLRLPALIQEWVKCSNVQWAWRKKKKILEKPSVLSQRTETRSCQRVWGNFSLPLKFFFFSPSHVLRATLVVNCTANPTASQTSKILREDPAFC